MPVYLFNNFLHTNVSFVDSICRIPLVINDLRVTKRLAMTTTTAAGDAGHCQGPPVQEPARAPVFPQRPGGRHCVMPISQTGTDNHLSMLTWRFRCHKTKSLLFASKFHLLYFYTENHTLIRHKFQFLKLTYVSGRQREHPPMWCCTPISCSNGGWVRLTPVSQGVGGPSH